MKTRFKLSIISILLLLSMLLPCFVGCDNNSIDTPSDSSGEDDTTAADDGTIKITLSEYKIVRPDAWENTVTADCLFFAEAFKTQTGDKSYICNTDIVLGQYGELSDEVLDELSTKKEVLLGATNRRESAKALEGVPDNSYIITVIDNKIVINSKSLDYTLEGMRYFISNFVNKSENGVITLPKDYRYISEELSNLIIADQGMSPYTIVYSGLLDDDGTVDPEVSLAQELKSAFKSTLGATVSCKRDTQSKLEREILIGTTSRPETVKFLQNLDYDEYGFGLVGNKLVVAGWNIVTTRLAVTQFKGYLSAARVKNDDGSYKLEAISTFNKVYTYKAAKWEMDIPAYEGGTLSGTNPSGGTDLLYYIVDTTEAAYDAYCKKVASNGYTLVTSNELSGNKFALYKGTKHFLYTYYTDYNKSVRIVTSKLDSKHPEYWTPESVPSYTKIAETSVTQMSHDYGNGLWGMGYIITLEDGSFVVFDGGQATDSASDHTKLYTTLKKLNKREDGVILIRAWFLTHDHRDHYNNFAKFCTTFGANGKRVKVLGAYVNLAGSENLDNAHDPRELLANSSNFKKLSDAVGGMELITLRTGMKFYLANAMFEIMYTEEDLYPQKIHYFNDTSTVTRVTIAGQKLLFLGDLKEDGSAVVCGMYGKDIASDFVQVSHHGWDGATVALYQNVGAKFVFWPGSSTEFTQQYYASGITQAVSRYLRDKSPAKIFWNASKTTTIKLPYKLGDRYEESN